MATEETSLGMLFIGVLTIALLVLICFLFLKMIDTLYMSFFKRPLWVHFYFKKKGLTLSQKEVLQQEFTFYNRLSDLNKKRFEHRVVCFLGNKEFIARKEFVFDDDKKLLISATAIMLTFGMRKYLTPIIEKIIVYPTVFYSTINNQYHKGEFNPKLKALVLSWEDFDKGFSISDDNLNLGIHEFTHAIHFNSMKRNDTSSILFTDGFSELHNLLLNEKIKNNIENSDYFRAYAFTNKFEFLAVVVESFIESPAEFRQEFPLLYKKIQQMLNFRFAGYE